MFSSHLTHWLFAPSLILFYPPKEYVWGRDKISRRVGGYGVLTALTNVENAWIPTERTCACAHCIRAYSFSRKISASQNRMCMHAKLMRKFRFPNLHIKRSLLGDTRENGMMTSLSEMWTQVSENILDQIKRLEETKERDRLELVSSLRFVLSALQRSLFGWTQWVNNPDIMTRFTQKDLEKMNKKLSEFTRSFIKYDLEATKLGAQKGLKAAKKVEKKKEERAEGFYV